MDFSFEYRKLGGFVYHVFRDPEEIKRYLMKWILREWQQSPPRRPTSIGR